MTDQTARVLTVAPETRVIALTPMDMLDRAVSQGASIEVLERLTALYERWEARQSRREFDEAIAAAKAEITPIARNAKGHNDKMYADFSAIAEVVDPIISKVGLSYRFRTAQVDRISVTCVISHKAGHSEETTLSGPADKTGNKNDIQAIGSTLTYLQRYSLVQALGLAAAYDDDGKGGNGPKTLPKKDAKAIYIKLQAEIDQPRTYNELRLWGLDAKERIETMPTDWQEILRTRFEERVAEFKQRKTETEAKSSGIPNAATEPEKFLAWADKAMAATKTLEMLEALYNSEIEPVSTGLFPPDRDELVGMFGRHERRFEP